MVVHSALVGADLHYPLGHSEAGTLVLTASELDAYLVRDASSDWFRFDTLGNRIVMSGTTGTAITIGSSAADHNIRINGYLRLTEQAAAPSASSDAGQLYAIDSGGVTQLRYRDSGGTIHTLTPVSSGTSVSLTDNTTGAYSAAEGANGYITINTNDGAESVVFGNTTTDPTFSFLGTSITMTQEVRTSGSPYALQVTAGAHTTLAAGTEASDVIYDLSRTAQFATGAITTQRAFRIDAPTYGFVGASTITTAVTLDIDAAPTAGTNCTITNNYALRVRTGVAQFAGGITAPGSSGFSEVYGRGASGAGNFITVLGYNSSSTAGTALGPNCALSTGSENIGINAGGSPCTITGSNSLIISPGGASSASHTRAYMIGDSLTSTANDQTQIRTLSVILGEGDEDASPPSNVTMRVTNAPSGNTAAGNYTLVSGRGRGSGAGGHLIFQTAPGIASSGTLNTAITRLEVEDTGQVNVSGAANGQSLQFMHVTESHTLAAAATSDTTINLPADAYVYFVSIRVTTLITGCTTLDVGIAGDTTRYGTGIALSAGTTNPGIDAGGPRPYSAATAIRFSAIGGGASFTAGVVRVTAYYATTVVASS